MKGEKVLIFSIALEGYEKIYKSCIHTIENYAKNNQYDFSLINSSPRDLLPIEAAWLKLPLLVAALEKGYEWVAFIDCDIDIRDFTPPFPRYFEQTHHSKSFFVARGKSGRVNSGVLFVKNTAEAIAFFKEVISNADTPVPEKDRTLFENGHIIHHSKGSQIIKFLDNSIWNNNTELNPESYLQHYSTGALRDWYMANRISMLLKFEMTVNRLINFMFKRKNRKLIRPEKIDNSIKELMPYYFETYPIFKK